MGRRVSKKVFAYDTATSDFQLSPSHVFLYDGWNLISETAHSTSSGQTSTNVYVWGLDLAEQSSGLARHSSPGAKAGGVGGLLSQTTIDATTTNSYFATADANGNISDYVDEAGNVAAHFEFDAFGRVTTESIAQSLEPDAFPFRFSSKYEDIETGLNYYGFRYYNAEQGRWLNRDPIGEGGGLNIYANCLNQCINKIDWLGLADCPCTSAQMLAAGQAYISCLDGKITEYNNCLSSCYTHGKIIGGFYNFHNGVMRQHNFPGSLPDPGLELQKAIKECIASSCAPILANAASDCEKDCHDY
jgi:RHS repeat-associated protein